MAKVLKLLLFPSLLVNGSIINSFTNTNNMINKDNNVSSYIFSKHKKHDKNIDLGHIADLKKTTIENAIKNHFNKAVWNIKLVKIGLQEALASVSIKDPKLQFRHQVKLVNFKFRPNKIDLDDIITNRDIGTLRNFNNRRAIAHKFFLEQIKKSNPQYDNAIWKAIQITHKNEYGKKATEQPVTNFTIYLTWNGSSIGSSPNLILHKINNIAINYALEKVSLKTAAQTTNLAKINNLNNYHILERFQQLNPAIDIVNLTVSNVKIASNGVGSAIIKTSKYLDADKIIYSDTIIVQFLTK